MPLYEYECEACGERFEVIRKFSDPPLDVCARCGKGPIRRLISSPAFHLKGTGWYITDYAQKGKSGGSTGEKSDKSDKSDKSGKSDTSEKADKAAKSDSSTSGDSSTTSSSSESKTKSDTPAKPASTTGKE
jgi:putative FmdB family regulatory protein